MTIRRATVEDAAALAALAERTFRDAFAADNRPQDMEHHCVRSYSPETQARELADPSIDTLVVEDTNHELAAYVQLRVGTPPAVVRGADPIEVWRFYVDRAHHGSGLAQSLMSAAFEVARRRRAQTVWLGVWERNPRAQAFYRKLGFVDVGAHQFHLGADIQTDRLMVVTLAPVVGR